MTKKKPETPDLFSTDLASEEAPNAATKESDANDEELALEDRAEKGGVLAVKPE